MDYAIVKGEPTDEELTAIAFAVSLHKREELVPVIRKSAFGLPQLRKPLHNNFRFGQRN